MEWSQHTGSFDVSSREAILRNFEVLEPNWKWSVPVEPEGNYSFKFSKRSLQSTFIACGEQAVALEGMARRDESRVSIVFVLAGEICMRDRRNFRTTHIPANHVASITDRMGSKLKIGPGSTWLSFQVPEAVLRQNFEDMTGKPYVQEFALPPTNFWRGDAQGLYRTLRRSEKELEMARPEERSMLAKAYEQLALIKLFTRLPHNLAETFGRSMQKSAPRQLLKAEAYMRENLYNAVSVEDLANAAGCSTRALQRMFRVYRGSTPMGILCRYRLAAAHGTIKAGQADSITDLAMSLQFSNPGRFSVLYKNAYGFSPSSALRFSRDGKRH
ncbi:helix-turn-helix transcriptional regulator [Rhizobium binxianense]